MTCLVHVIFIKMWKWDISFHFNLYKHMDWTCWNFSLHLCHGEMPWLFSLNQGKSFNDNIKIYLRLMWRNYQIAERSLIFNKFILWYHTTLFTTSLMCCQTNTKPLVTHLYTATPLGNTAEILCACKNLLRCECKWKKMLNSSSSF